MSKSGLRCSSGSYDFFLSVDTRRLNLALNVSMPSMRDRLRVWYVATVFRNSEMLFSLQEYGIHQAVGQRQSAVISI